jgi:hypothetical protein
VTELPVRHHARRFGESKYGLSRIWKVTSDLITLRMLSGFRERPLAMFGAGAFGASLLSLLFIVLTTIGLAGVDPGTGSAGGDFVFPSVALVFLSLAFFLLLLGLVGEVAISGARESDELHLPISMENSRWLT